MSYYMADRKHRKAFLEARQSLEVKLNLEEQSQQQVKRDVTLYSTAFYLSMCEGTKLLMEKDSNDRDQNELQLEVELVFYCAKCFFFFLVSIHESSTHLRKKPCSKLTSKPRGPENCFKGKSGLVDPPKGINKAACLPAVQQERLLLSILPKHIADEMLQDMKKEPSQKEMQQFNTMYMYRHENVR